jgi:hypothetical protein
VPVSALDLAGALNNLALLYGSQGHDRKAVPLYKRALSILEKTVASITSRSRRN